jgi:Asp-tRNA(Asn)/Glu-tRNA(Gln) amidotransferase A subunit family amidase
MSNPSSYDVKSIKSPTVRGPALRMAAAALERPWIASVMAPVLTRPIGMAELRAAKIDESPTFLPLHPVGSACATGNGSAGELRPGQRPDSGFRFRGIRDFGEAYRSGAVTPEQVAERVIEAIQAGDREPAPLRAFIACQPDDVRRQARDSSRRYRDKCPLGPLDGVPVAVKDLVDMVPYPTTAGTSFLGNIPARRDSTVVARLRRAGAMLAGKTNMHEIGILPDARNPHFGPVRNPYSLAHEAGGSSAGSAAAVAAGLCAAAVGADGGGSIRIPAAHCGVVGLKPTYGRVSEWGDVPLAWSVTHLGPIAAGVEDTALMYGVMAGPDPQDPHTLGQPEPAVGECGSLNGIRIGVYREWFSDAAECVAAACEGLLHECVRQGAELVSITIPELRLIAVAHGLTIHAEMAAAMQGYNDEHRRDLSLTTRLMLANVRAMRSSDYVQAQRMRTRAIAHFREALTRADVIATPTAPVSAPALSRAGIADRDSDIGRVFEVMRFVNPANFTGLPAITVPAGYDPRGLPVGLQLMARPWEEELLFRLAYAAERAAERRRPPVYFDLLAS